MGRRKKGELVNGWLLLDKPYDISSTKALGRVRWLFDAKKAGHGGTLDPLATGVLPLAFGEATKTIPYVIDSDKTYVFEVTFGTATSTDDIEGEVIETSLNIPSRTDIENILPKFIGKISQTPPAFSAIKIDGERAYKKARSGEEVTMKSREVTINSLELLDYTDKKATLKADVSKGTYIRALGRDMAKSLGSCGHISVLRRVAIGKMTEQKAITLEEIEKIVANAGGKGHIPESLLYDVDWVLDGIPAYQVTAEQAFRLSRGQDITLPQAPVGLVRVKEEDGKILSLLEVGSDGSAKVARNFNL